MARGIYRDVKVNKTKYIYANVPLAGLKKMKRGYVGTKDGVKIFYMSSVTQTFIDNFADKREIMEVESYRASIENGRYKILSESYPNGNDYEGYVRHDLSLVIPSFALEPKFQCRLYGFSSHGEGRIEFRDDNNKSLKLYNYYTSNVTPSVPIPKGAKYVYVYSRNNQPTTITQMTKDSILVDDYSVTFEVEDWVTKMDNYTNNREIVGVENGNGIIYQELNKVTFRPYSNSETNYSDVVSMVYDATKIHDTVKQIEITTYIKSMTATNDGKPKVYFNLEYADGGYENFQEIYNPGNVRITFTIPTGKKIKNLRLNTYVTKNDFYSGSTANIEIGTLRYSYLQ